LKNDITRTTPASFEPTIDYVVVKWPRFAFEKFPGADPRLGTQMKSVGEAMAIGRTFAEAIEKAARSLEIGRDGLESLIGIVDHRALREGPDQRRDLVMDAPAQPRAGRGGEAGGTVDELRADVAVLATLPLDGRLFHVVDAIRLGVSRDDLATSTGIDPWFLAQLERIVAAEREVGELGLGDRDALLRWKRLGLGDRRIAKLAEVSEADARQARASFGLRTTYGCVDTCAAEFPAKTPYLYGTYETESEATPSDRKKVVILGGGPNRIGQGIEFDYCCVHASMALREAGIETIMVNCNPETVSTDFDTSDRLYFEPLTLEDVLSICAEESRSGELLGVLVQLGGQTPLRLATALTSAGVHILGTSADAIDRAEDRGRFEELLDKLGLCRPLGVIARGTQDAIAAATRIGFPVVVRPSYVLGGRAMMVCRDEQDLDAYIQLAVEAAREAGTQAILVDQFLEDAIEVDVDAIGDGTEVRIGGVMQHVEEAGVHSGDSASVLPPYSLSEDSVAEIVRQTKQIGLELQVIGLMNIQFAVKDGKVFIIEVNPRASRTVPFVSKATGRPLAKIAARVMLGEKLADLRFFDMVRPAHVAVKESVFPFAKFPGVDTQLGPEMRSTGEVMGIARTFERAFWKAQLAAGNPIPTSGRVFISVKDSHKPVAVDVARRLRALGFSIVATGGTADAMRAAGVETERVNKVAQGAPHIVDAISAGSIALVINTTEGTRAIRDSYAIRRQTLLSNIPYFTTIPAALAVAGSLEGLADGADEVRSLQEWNAG